MAKAAKKSGEAEEEAEAAEGAVAEPKGKKQLVIIVAAALAVLCGSGGGAYFFVFKKPHEEKPVAAVVKPPTFLDLPDVLVNLSGSGTDQRARYLKAKIVLEVTDQKVADEIKPVMPRVMDSFQTYLRELRTGDLEGSAGLYRMRDELTRRINIAVAPSKINAVLFKEVVVQ
jgi:flagellar FliL protein